MSPHMGAVVLLMGAVQRRFITALVDAMRHAVGADAEHRLRQGLSAPAKALLATLSEDSPELATYVSVAAGIDLVVSCDVVLCGGSGRLLTQAGSALAARILARSPGLVTAGDPLRTLQHLKGGFEHPFVDAQVHFQVQSRSTSQLALNAWLEGHPGAVKAIGALALGYARTAAEFSGDARRTFDLSCDEATGRAHILSRSRVSPQAGVIRPRPTLTLHEGSRPDSSRARARPSLADHVNEILGRSVRPSSLPGATTPVAGATIPSQGTPWPGRRRVASGVRRAIAVEGPTPRRARSLT